MTSMNGLPRRCGVVAYEHKGALVDLELKLCRVPDCAERQRSEEASMLLPAYLRPLSPGLSVQS